LPDWPEIGFAGISQQLLATDRWPATLARMHPPAEERPGLLRALGAMMATAVVVGTVIGSGIFKKPQSVAENVPNFAVVSLVWILGGVLALLGALALTEVAVLFPKAGGNYVFLREGYGRLAGFLWGWVEFWIIRAASIAALATIFAESLSDIVRDASSSSGLSFWEQRGMTVAIIVTLAIVNIRGVRWGGGLQLFITLVKVGSLLAITFLPLLLLLGLADAGRNPTPAVENRVAFTWGGLGTAFLGVLWAYHGWMNLAPMGAEVKNPQRTIPIAFLAGVGTIIFLYLGANLAYHLVIPQAEMAQLKDTTVATEFCRRLLGPAGAMAASAAVMCSVFGAVNGNLLVGPRVLYAMGEDRLAPKALGAIHPTYHTPAMAIAVVAGWAALLVLLAGAVSDVKAPFDILTDYVMFGAVIFETLAVTTIFVFRRRYPDGVIKDQGPLPPDLEETITVKPRPEEGILQGRWKGPKPQRERPYRCWGYPYVPALYLILPAFILGNMFVNQQMEALAGTAFILLGTVVYWLFLRR
jgi:amino acid transporter